MNRMEAVSEHLSRCLRVVDGGEDISIMAVRECGDCVGCCLWPSISNEVIEPEERELMPEKPASVLCQHCDGSKCSIYSKRPTICRSYYCLWALGLTDKPPMQAKVAWTFQPDLSQPSKDFILVTGHCFDADEVLSDPDNLADLAFFKSLPWPMKVSAILLRGRDRVVRLDNLGLFPDLQIKISETCNLRERVDPATEELYYLPTTQTK